MTNIKLLIFILFLLFPFCAFGATGDIIYQNCYQAGACTGAGSSTGWSRSVTSSGCQYGSCLRLDASVNGSVYGADDTEIQTSISGYNDITVEFYAKLDPGNRSISGCDIKSIRPFNGGSSYIFEAIDGHGNYDHASSYHEELVLEPESTVTSVNQNTDYCTSIGGGLYYCPHRIELSYQTSDTQVGLPTDTWRHFRYYLKLPSSGGVSGDGEVYMWVDDELIYHAFNISSQAGDSSTFTGLDFYPSSEASEAFSHWLDEMVIYEGYVPPGGSGTPGTAGTQWEPMEISLTASGSPSWYSFPAQVTFTHTTSGTTKTLDAYWDGGSSWKVRFSPSLSGAWTWESSSSDSGLNGQSGSLDIAIATTSEKQSNPNLRGHLKKSADNRTLEYSDGTPFFWMGDTIWAFSAGRCGVDGAGEFYTYVDDRADKDFNVVQVMYFSQDTYNEGGYAFPDNTGSSPGNGDWNPINPSYFQSVDTRMDYLFDEGFVVAGHPAWLSAKTVTLTWAERIMRYMMARYGAYNTVWSLTGEYQFSRDEPTSLDCPGDWTTLGNYIQSYNPYDNMVTIHPTNGAPSYIDGRTTADYSSSGEFHNRSWLDINWIQTYAYIEDVSESTYTDYQKTPTKPVIMAEPGYEFFRPWASNEQVYSVVTGYHSRLQAWSSILNGAAGHTYGAWGVWQFYDSSHPQPGRTDSSTDEWYNRLDSTGANDMRHVRSFFEAINWEDLVPRRSWLRVNGSAPSWPSRTNFSRPHMAAITGNTYVVYIPEGNGSNIISITNLESNSYIARWFNPRTGAYTDISNGPSNVSSWNIPSRPSSDDWVLVLTFDSGVTSGEFFSDDFSSGDLSHSENGATWGASNYGSGDSVSVVSTSHLLEESPSGGNALRFHFNGDSGDSLAEQRFNFGTNNHKTDLYARFHIYFPSGAEVGENKYVHRSSTSSNRLFRTWGNSDSDDSIMGAYMSPLSNLSNIYGVSSVQSSYSPRCSGNIGRVTDNLWEQVSSELGEWHAVEMRYKVDDGSGNGAIELWLDGSKQSGSMTGLYFSDGPCSPGYFAQAAIMGLMGSGFASNTNVYIDDIAFSDEYIGPAEGGGAGGGEIENAYHIDPNAGEGGDGSAADPFNSWSDLPSISTGWDIYIKCGTTLTAPSNGIRVTWNGTNTDRSVIGAYYMSGSTPYYGVSGSKPIISGNNHSYPTGTVPIYTGLIDIRSHSYITIQDLRIDGSRGDGIRFEGDLPAGTTCAYTIIDNCDVVNSYMAGIRYIECDYNYAIIRDNYLYNNVLAGNWNGSPFAPEYTAHAAAFVMRDCPYAYALVEGNTTFENYGETYLIGAQDSLITAHSGHVILQDNLDYGEGLSYFAAVEDIIYRRNIIFGGNHRWGEEYSGVTFRRPGIGIGNEDQAGEGNETDVNRDIYIYDNLIADVSLGIWFGMQHDTDIWRRIHIFNNTFIGTYRGVWNNNSNITFYDCTLRNNAFYHPSGTIYTSPQSNLQNYSGWTVSNNGGNGAAFGSNWVPESSHWTDPYGAGWQQVDTIEDLEDFVDALSADDFTYTSDSDLKDAGYAVGSEYATDFYEGTRPVDGAWDIGAFEVGATTGEGGSGYDGPWYVDNSGGSDSGEGSIGDPFETINHAASVAGPGSTIYIREGTYSEAITVGSSGTSGSLITIRPYSTENVIFSGPASSMASSITINGDYIKIYDIIFNRQSTGHDSEETVNIDVYGDNVEISECDIQGDGADADRLAGTAEIGIRLNGGDGLNVSDSEISGLSGKGILISDDGSNYPHFFKIDSNNIYDVFSAGIEIDSISSEMLYGVIRDNTIYDCIAGSGIRSRTSEPQYSSPTVWGVWIINNVLKEISSDNQIDLSGARYFVVERNEIQGGSGDSSGYYDSLNDLNGGKGVNIRNAYLSFENIIRGNVILDNSGGIEASFWYRIYNNTIINNQRDYSGSDATYLGNIGKRFLSGIYARDDGVKIINNIFGGHPFCEVVIRPGDSNGYIDYNLFLEETQTPGLCISDGSTISEYELSGFQSAISAESIGGKSANAVIGDGDFQSGNDYSIGPPEALSFAILSDSDAINAGGSLTVTSNSGSNSSNMSVSDAKFFSAGSNAIGVSGDTLLIDGSTEVNISSINDNSITLSSPATWSIGNSVIWCPDGECPSDGIIDIGAYQYGDATQEPARLQNGSPSGQLPELTNYVSITMTTDNIATVKYSTSPLTPYSSMDSMDSTDSTTHELIVYGLSASTSYTYYFKAYDGDSDYSISFDVPPGPSGNILNSQVYSSATYGSYYSGDETKTWDGEVNYDGSAVLDRNADEFFFDFGESFEFDHFSIFGNDTAGDESCREVTLSVRDDPGDPWELILTDDCYLNQWFTTNIGPNEAIGRYVKIAVIAMSGDYAIIPELYLSGDESTPPAGSTNKIKFDSNAIKFNNNYWVFE